jgi:hypothetical protein
MILQKLLGFLVKRWATLVLLFGLAVCGYIQRHSPAVPDPASGHVIKVVVLRSRRTVRHTVYLTSSEQTLYHASFLVMAVGAFGMIGPALIRKRDRANSLV